MEIKIKHPIVYDGSVLQRGKVYDTKDLKIADKHIHSWIEKRLVVKVDKPTENKVDAPEETKETKAKFTEKQLEKKSVDELKELANTQDIFISSDALKADIIKAILEG